MEGFHRDSDIYVMHCSSFDHGFRIKHVSQFLPKHYPLEMASLINNSTILQFALYSKRVWHCLTSILSIV